MTNGSVRIDVTTEDGAKVACEMRAPSGAHLVDACDAHDAPVEFSCRAACCSSCRVRVLQGGEHLAAPDASEQELIAASGKEPDVRYCCAATLRADAPIGAVVRLQPLGPAF